VVGRSDPSSWGLAAKQIPTTRGDIKSRGNGVQRFVDLA
jgi:hypothetical protein